MKDFFKGVRRRIDKLDADRLRSQYEIMSDELARTEKLLNVLKDGVVLVDSTGKVSRSNPAAQTLLGGNPSDIVPTLGLPIAKASRREISISYPDARILEAQTIPFEDETVIYLRDITSDRERTEQELRAGATKAVCDLAAGVAHEIGNPLNAIALSLQLLKRDPSDTSTVDTCMSQVKRLDSIIREFLAAIRPQRPNLLPGSIAEPLKNCLAALKQVFEERRITVTLDIPAALPNVALDASQMEQVFFNLLKNALEAIRDNGTISIALDSNDQDVSVVFHDDGIGMDAQQLAHLFEPYRTTKEKGSGLGLMVSKRIVTEHGGTIAAESEPGKGTSFTIILPRIERRIRALK